jgi:thiol-disulfide isomerase/thioredoxin
MPALPVALLAWLLALPFPAPANNDKSTTTMEVIRLADWPAVVADAQPDVLVVDIWASWCISCIERFPEMVAMAARYQGRGVSFLTLNLDDPKDVEGIEWSNGFLARIGADFPNYHLQENLTESFEALDLLAIPVVLIYDGQGEERYRLTNDNPNDQFTKADIEAAVQALLAEKG